MTYDSANVFARILRKEIPAAIVHEDDHVLAIHDAFPAAPTHVLVMPKGEYISFHDFCAQAPEDKIAYFFSTVQRVATKLGLAPSGYRLIMNHGTDASQTVPHFHVHILGGKPLGGLLSSDTKLR